MRHLATTILLLSCVAAMCSPAAAQIIETPETKVIPKLTVSGKASLQRPADQLQITVGVQTEDAEAGKALDENSRRMKAIVKALSGAGLAKDEFQTGRFRIRPQYSRRPQRAEPGWQPQIIGYEVVNAVDIRTGKLDLAGELIEAANKAGANSIDNIRFDLEDERSYRREAIAEATANAIADARALAGAAGVRLVRLLSIHLNDAAARTTDFRASAMMRGRAAEGSPAPPIKPGEVTIVATVTTVYEIAATE